MFVDELAAAQDYWAQVYERLRADPEATLVEREKVIAHITGGEFEWITRAYGFPSDLTEDLEQEYLARLKSAPETSPGADPHAEAIMDHLCKRIEAACKRSPLLRTHSVALGIEPNLGVFASRMGVLMTDASVITVGSQVFRFCNVVAKALTQTVAVDPPAWDVLDDTGRARSALRARPEVLSYWVHAVASFTMLGTSIYVPFNVPPPELAGLRGEILDAMEIFLIAHEYSHHILRHGRLQAASPESGTNIDAHREEFEADALAIAIGQMVTGHTADENLLMLSGVGMVVLLHTLRMLDEARELLGMKVSVQESHASHPSVAARIAFVDHQAWLWPKLDTEFRHFRSAYGNMLEVVWDEIRPVLKSLSQDLPASRVG